MNYLILAVSALFLITGTHKETTEDKKRLTIADKAPLIIEEITAPFKMPQLKRPEFPNRLLNILEYGAKGDSVSLNTNAFKKAIEACYTAGGGKVIVPSGKWLTGAIHLKSNVNLHFEEGAEIHFSTNPDNYLPVVFTRWTGFELYNYSPLIYAKDCENIAVTGPGKLFGHGESWWKWEMAGEETAWRVYYEQVLKDVLPDKRVYGTPEAGFRPQFINPVNCKNVLFEGFTIVTPGPFWTFDILYCENVIVRGLKLNTVGGPNTDGINLNSSKNVLVEYCHINSGDDCIAFKSGLNEDGWRVARPTENVVIRNIYGLRSHGGIVIGSEMSGGVRNIYAHDCEFNGAERGIRLKSNASRGGIVEKIWYENITMKNMSGEAIRINTNYGAYMADEGGTAYPVFREINIKNIKCDGAQVALSMMGTSHKPIEDITLENISIKAETGMKFNWVNNLELKNVSSIPLQGKSVVFENCKNVVTK